MAKKHEMAAQIDSNSHTNLNNIADHLNEGNTPNKALLDAAIKRTARGNGHVPSRVTTKTASVMEIPASQGVNNSETGSGKPSANETLSHAQ